MKTFRLIGMALLAVVMCVNFASCSDDDEPSKNDDGVITNQKQLVELRRTNEDGDSEITRYSYNSNGKLVSTTQTTQYNNGSIGIDTDTATYIITWGANKIIENECEGAITYTLKNGLVTHISSRNGGYLNNTDFTYNANNQLVKLQDDEESYQSHTWQGKKLTKITWNSNDWFTELSFTYSGKTCKGYLPRMAWYVYGSQPLLEAHPELVGMRCNQLPDKTYEKMYDKELDEDREETILYSYTFDKDGYLESCTEVSTYTRPDYNETSTSTIIYTFTWE